MKPFSLRGITEADVRGKRVLLRTCLNPADDGNFSDDRRLFAALPTLRYLHEAGAKIILIGYFGREKATLRPVAESLARIAAPIAVHFTDASIANAAAEVEALAAGDCLVLENTRLQDGEEKNDPSYARALASLADMFIDDSFAEAHRAYASNVGVAALLPSYAGFLMEQEVARLSEARNPPPRAMAVIGGAKFETKQPLIEKLLERYACVAVGGALANDFLQARGHAVGASLVSPVPVPERLANSEKILTPEDVMVESAAGRRSAAVTDIGAHESVCDIGENTAQAWSARIAEADFILWNGPLGMYEEGCVRGTDAIASAVIANGRRAVIGGGDTAAALKDASFDAERVFLSTGGGAMLEFLTSGTLPGIEVLRKR